MSFEKGHEPERLLHFCFTSISCRHPLSLPLKSLSSFLSSLQFGFDHDHLFSNTILYLHVYKRWPFKIAFSNWIDKIFHFFLSKMKHFISNLTNIIFVIFGTTIASNCYNVALLWMWLLASSGILLIISRRPFAKWKCNPATAADTGESPKQCHRTFQKWKQMLLSFGTL